MQGFLLLSEYEVTQGNDRPGWMYCGIACRMLSDLGLHELADINHVALEGTDNEATRESALAYALVAACIVYEGVWTLYLGRPSSIPKSIISIAAARCKSHQKSDSPLLNAWLGLCVPMSEISHILNNQYVGDFDASSSLPNLIAQMQDWYNTLPPELVYVESRLTNLDMAGYGLHTQYCKVQILLRQALARCPNPRKRRYSQISGDSIPGMMSEDSSRAIYQEALRIARLVVTYREVFGVEKIPSIMLDNAVVAATTLIHHFNQVSSSHDVQQRDAVWVRSLIKSLEAVQPHFPITKRMLDALKHISAEGSLVDFFHSPAAGGPAIPAPGLSSGCESYIRGPDSNAVLNKPDAVWASFGVDLAPTTFFWGGLDNIFSDVPPSGDPLLNPPHMTLS
ncbi:hypothetical protein A1O3_04180 [Capronia epimyces CBS 606.96]|uniref:Xylanolytic transcriptional activator regulatory domain-containing protein n=1 Tax=Capronia epimyces CBS 606.96 TaxID=1182542 RepID=W9YD82_9EURO|nr:uncharacterized protein A1O3_04180 [Capronia epimyces CBS 606.96]EXJ87221.1 hypothetical protein A1O3_04180 [Capronia epimyces CBS 606.96]